MISSPWLWIAAVLAGIDWIAVEKNWKWVEYFTKPGTMIALLVWLWTAGGGSPILPFALGAAFSLTGDVLLMLPRGPFIAGLIAFLLAHISYIIGFNKGVPPFTLAGLLLVFIVGIASSLLYRRLAQALHQKKQAGLQTPVAIYALAISLMLLSALLTLTRADWARLPALFASAGGAFFFLSDSLLAWDRFVTPLSHRGVKVMVTYHLGQFGILAAAILRFS